MTISGNRKTASVISAAVIQTSASHVEGQMEPVKRLRETRFQPNHFQIVGNEPGVGRDHAEGEDAGRDPVAAPAETRNAARLEARENEQQHPDDVDEVTRLRAQIGRSRPLRRQGRSKAPGVDQEGLRRPTGVNRLHER